MAATIITVAGALVVALASAVAGAYYHKHHWRRQRIVEAYLELLSRAETALGTVAFAASLLEQFSTSIKASERAYIADYAQKLHGELEGESGSRAYDLGGVWLECWMLETNPSLRNEIDQLSVLFRSSVVTAASFATLMKCYVIEGHSAESSEGRNFSHLSRAFTSGKVSQIQKRLTALREKVAEIYFPAPIHQTVVHRCQRRWREAQKRWRHARGRS